MKQKASQLATAQGKEFNPSDGWLSRWKARNNVKEHREHGEKQDADLPAAAEWKTSILPGILQTFESINIFNADETALYFRGYPN